MTLIRAELGHLNFLYQSLTSFSKEVVSENKQIHLQSCIQYYFYILAIHVIWNEIKKKMPSESPGVSLINSIYIYKHKYKYKYSMGM